MFSLDDMKTAYRQVPTSDPEMCIVCVYSFAKGNVGPRFYECWGHNFGHVSSVYNYNRTPLFCCQVAWCLFAVPQEYYVDDHCTPDFEIADAPDCGAATALSALHDILCLQLESDKHVEFSPSPGRTELVNEMLYNASKQGLDQHTAQVVKGKIGSILQSVWGRVARTATQPPRISLGKESVLSARSRATSS